MLTSGERSSKCRCRDGIRGGIGGGVSDRVSPTGHQQQRSRATSGLLARQRRERSSSTSARHGTPVHSTVSCRTWSNSRIEYILRRQIKKAAYLLLNPRVLAVGIIYPCMCRGGVLSLLAILLATVETIIKIRAIMECGW